MEGDISKFNTEHATKIYHHIHLLPNENGIDVEVHFRPSSGNYDPFTNHRLQVFLEKEIDRDNELTGAGFRVPSLRFALIMQMAHIQRHFIGSGMGMRQVIDYYFLLKQRGARREVRGERIPGKPLNDIQESLKQFGLRNMAGALMWVLHEKLELEEKYLIAPMDEKRGKMLLAVMMEGGNFGYYSPQRQEVFSITGLLKYRFKKYRLLKFDARETIWGELNFLVWVVTSIPERIRRRSLTLR